jgi:signal transduction histidine kinase
VRNVLLNACQAMPMGGEVGIHWDIAPSGLTQLRIRDQGSGLSQEARERFGEPFFSTKEGGLGLGLNLVTEVMRAHGGSVEAENHPSGAEITLCFPAPGSEPNPIA